MTQSRAPIRGTVTFSQLAGMRSWGDLPPVVVAAGNAAYFKESLLRRFMKHLFGEHERILQRFEAKPDKRRGDRGAGVPLADVLDELRTPNMFSPYRVVVVENGDAFLSEHGEVLLPFLQTGFSGGYLIVFVDSKPDGRRKFTRQLTAHGWLVECMQPFDRPPPWETRTPIWNSDLSRWAVAQAKSKGIQMDLQTAFTLHDRVGTDLAVLDEELEKLLTYLGSRGENVVTAETILQITGDLRDNTVFTVLDLFLEGRRADCLRELRRLFEHGYEPQKGPRVMEPHSIALMLISTMVPKLRAIRRARTLGPPQEWIQAGLVQKPFLPRFQRQVGATSPERIERVLHRLFEIDRSIKSGGQSEVMVEALVAQHGNPG